MVRFLTVPLAVAIATLAACGGGSGGGPTDPPILPNDPPSIQSPSGLSGTAPSYVFTLPVAASQALVFSATDPNGDSLTWQVGVDGTAAAAAGLTFTAPVTGNTFTFSIAPVATPAAVTLSLLVEDPRGAVAAIDLRLLRSGPPTLTAVAPNSAFVDRPQSVRLTGTAFQLGGSALTTVAFDGVAATGTVILGETQLTCSTPIGTGTGATVVGVANQFGNVALPASAFTVYAFPPVFAANDTRIDAGDASGLELAREVDTVHAVWRESSAVVHRVSTDRGATWSLPATLSGLEAATEPQVIVAGARVLVAWIGDQASVWVRRSIDGGATFQPAQRLDSTASPAPARRPRLAQSGARRYVAWLSGDASLGAARVLAVASSDNGVGWTSQNVVSDGGANQQNHALACDGITAWVLCEDERTPPGQRGAYVVRTIDGGSTWLPALRLNTPSAVASEVRLATAPGRLYASWLQAVGALGNGLFLSTSPDGGATWSTTIIELQGPQGGAVSSPWLVSDATRLTATYVIGGTAIGVATFSTLGATVQRTTIESAVTASAAPTVTQNGNYVFVAWREGDVGSGTARVQYSVSANSGTAFQPPVGLGDGTAAQDQPRLAVEGAHILLGWIDRRNVTDGVFINRTAP